MTTVNDFTDILRIIRQQPEWADALRVALLGQDLPGLPRQFAEFAASAEQRFFALEGDVSELKDGQARLESGQVRLESSVSWLNGQVGNMRGNDYQMKVGNNIASIAIQHLKLRSARVLKGYKVFDDMPFHDLLFDAEGRGVISEQERLDIGNADVVLLGRTHPEQSTVYIVIEVSLTAADYDINRAADWANILHRATGENTIPAVVSAQWDSPRRQLAQERGVTTVTISEYKQAN